MTLEKAPFLVTIFVAACAWAVTRTADGLTGIPFIEYRLDRADDKVESLVEVRLRNITSKRFDCFALTLSTVRSEGLEFGEVDRQERRIRGTAFPSLKVNVASKEAWMITVERMSPGADQSLYVPVQGHAMPRLLIAPCPTPMPLVSQVGAASSLALGYEKSEKADLPILVPRSLTTFLIEFQTQVLWSVLIFWFFVLVFGETLRVPSAPRWSKKEP